LVLVGYLVALNFSTEIWRKRLVGLLIALIVLGIISGILLFIFADQLQGSRIAQLFTLQGWTPRLGSWEAAIKSIKASPIIGFGLGCSYNLYFIFSNPDARLFHGEHSYNHVHSEILEYVQESGILGIVLFLCFWGYLVFQLIKAIREDSTSPTIKKLAIGILGGFVGYHFHGLFSVAPRMMVMKLPLFTLIGLAFIIIKLMEPISNGESAKSFEQRLRSFAPAFLMVIVIWIIYLPWIIGQYQFVNIQRERPSVLQVEKLEKLVEPKAGVLNLLSHQDAYALDTLSHLQVRYRRTEQLQNTVNLIDKVFPKYRELGHTKAVLAVMQNDLGNAIKQGLAFQNQDRYYNPTISLLLNLAVETDNSQLFYQQFRLFVRKLAFEKGLVSGLDSQAVEMRKKTMTEPYTIQDQGGKIIMEWNEKLIDGFFNSARFSRKNRSYSATDRNKFISSLIYLFFKHPYFQIDIFQQYRENDTKTIYSSMQSYFRIKGESDKKSMELTKKHKEQLVRTIPENMLSLQKKQAEEMEKTLKPYQDEIKRHTDLLKKKTDWVVFLKKRDFANGFIEEIIKVIFPQTGK
ncbi:O-antigen ligase family protein, partial [bacterium]|nr:O-antigen ligase family protein [bacterium]